MVGQYHVTILSHYQVKAGGSIYNHFIYPVNSGSCLFFYSLLNTEMSLESQELETEVMGITARERVLWDPDMLDTIFSYLDLDLDPRTVVKIRRVSR